MRIKCLAQEYNTISLARARARTARSGGKRTNQDATAPLELFNPSALENKTTVNNCSGVILANSEFHVVLVVIVVQYFPNR